MWKNYLRTVLITLSVAGLSTFTAYSYCKTQDQVERAESMLDRNSHLEEEILDDIQIQKGWHLCGMETVSEQSRVYREVAGTPEFKQWENTLYQGEKRVLDNLLCSPSLSTKLGA